jgi:signal transduction histidine kinase
MTGWRTIATVAAVAVAGTVGTIAAGFAMGFAGAELGSLARALAPAALVAIVVAVVAGRFLARTSLTGSFVGVALVAAAIALANVFVLTRQMFVSDHDAALISVVLIYAVGAGVATAIAAARASGSALRRLDDTARRLGDGDLDARVGDLRAGDELETLGRTLDAMADHLGEARDAERRAEEMRRDLIATMSHDLRTPLAALRAMVEAVDDGVVADPATVRRYSSEMRGSVDQLVTLVDDLFELTQLDADVIASAARRARVDEMVTSAIDVVAQQAALKHLRLETDLGTASELGCSPSMARVLQNLLTNAIRHTPADGAVRVVASADDDWLHLAVEDDGEGISAEHLPHVFEPFYRADPARSGPGAGLGLALAKRIVEALGGSIRAESQDGAGARFAVQLPRV